MIVSFTDLDNTLFSSIKKNLNICSVITRKDDETASSGMSSQQQKIFDLLNSNTTVIPVTGRNLQQFLRVKLPFNSYAVLSFGGLILNPDKSVNEEWSEKITSNVSETLFDCVYDLCRETYQILLPHAKVRIVSELGKKLYIVVKSSSPRLRSISDAMKEDERLYSFNILEGQDEIAIIPKTFSKRLAVDFLKKELLKETGENCLFLGCGDSISDISFMSSCHFSIVPHKSQIYKMFAGEF